MPKSSQKDYPFVSVITVNWNGLRLLERLLPHLEKQSYPRDKYEIVILDNDSSDNSVDFLKSKYKDIVLIENSNNDGFARGCNIGILSQRAKYYVLVNNDTIPKESWLASLVERAETDQHIGAVTSKLLFLNKGDGSIINNAGSVLYPNRAWPVEEIGANKKDGPEYNKPREITAFSGASLLLSHKMLKDIGLFDERFFMYFEDADLSWRGQKAGWKYYYEPKSVILHEHSASSKEHSNFWVFYVTRNRLLIIFKHAKWNLALKVYLTFIRDFMMMPVFNLLRARAVRHQLHLIKLGFKINGSFLFQLGPTLFKRFGWVSERKIET